MKEENQIRERYELTIERIRAILEEETVAPRYLMYFQSVARFILNINALYWKICKRNIEECSIEELIKENQMLYEDVVSENYKHSFANPAYAVSLFDKEMGQFLSFLYVEMRAQIAYAYEKRISYLTICNELFIEIYNAFEEEETPNYKNLKEIIYWYASDYSDVFFADRIEERMNAEKTYVADMIMQSDFTDRKNLYWYGEYIAEDEWKMQDYLNSLSEEQIEQIADIYTQGYEEISDEKDTVYIQYAIGTERVVKKMIRKFQEMGLKTSICRNSVSALTRESKRNGFYSRSMNTRFELDHAMDQGLFLNKKYIERKLDVMKNAYEKHVNLAEKFAGSVIVGAQTEEEGYQACEEAIKLNEKQVSLQMLLEEKMEQLTNKYLLKELNIQVVDIE